MFNNIEEFTEWLEISKTFDSKKIQKVYTFIDTFPLADFTDYIKVAKKIGEGQDINSIISRYKRHIKSVGEKDEDEFVEISKMENVYEEMKLTIKNGLLKGSTTHIPIIDNCWKWRESEFTLLTGYNADGKSIYLRYLALIKGIMDGWKTAAFAPEDYPAPVFFDELIMTAAGYNTDKDSPNFIGEKLFDHVYEKIKDLFHYVNIRPPKSTLLNILNAFVPLIEYEGVKICFVDPLLKITRPKEYMNSDALWAMYVDSICTDFARRFNVCLILVLHQLTPKLTEAGVYVKPDKYTVKGGGNYSDGTDNVLFLYRPEAPQNNASTIVRFGSLKIKKHRLVAIPNEVLFKFNRMTNRYVTEDTEQDLFNFDEPLEIPRMKLLF